VEEAKTKKDKIYQKWKDNFHKRIQDIKNQTTIKRA
jgi:hypothetical protein